MDPTIESDNALADKTLELVDRLRPHARAIVMGLGGAALVLFAWLLVSNQTTAGRNQSWDAFLDAVASDSQPMLVDSLGDVIRRHPGTSAAQWSEVVLADFAVSEGTDLLFSNKEQGRQRLQSAVDAYSAVLAARPRGLLATRATFGLAKARESLGQLDDAQRGYEAVATEQSSGGFAHLATQRVAALNRPATKEWYDWFAAQTFTPPPPAAAGAGAASGDDQPAPPAASPAE
jgi:hypothetical protein